MKSKMILNSGEQISHFNTKLNKRLLGMEFALCFRI